MDEIRLRGCSIDDDDIFITFFYEFQFNGRWFWADMNLFNLVCIKAIYTTY